MRHNPYTKYKQMEVDTTDPLKLVVMLYDGAISSLKLAIGYIEKKEYEAKYKQLDKAQNIIFELMSSLDHERGGEVASNLNSLYTFMVTRIIEANSTLDTGLLQEIIGLLDNLNSAWKELGKQATIRKNANDNVILGRGGGTR